MEKEEFKILEDFPAYRISNTGIVQTRARRGKIYDEDKRYTEDWRNISLSTKGPKGKEYLGFMACNIKRKEQKSLKVHILVAKYFIGEKPEWAEVIRHLDGNRFNNNVENLAYGTYVENEYDKLVHNINFDRANISGKLRREEIEKIRSRYNNGEKQVELAKEFKVSRPTITRIINRSIWK